MADQAGSGGAAEVAARIRRDREQLVAELSDGTTDLTALIGPTADPRAAAVKVVRLAEVVPGVGKVRSRRVLEDLGVRPDARWGELTPARAVAVVRALAQASATTLLPPAGGASPAGAT